MAADAALVIVVCRLLYYTLVVDRFDVDALDEDWPFDIDRQASHLFKHPGLGVDDIGDVWASEPLFYPAKPPAHWLMVAEVVPSDWVLPRRRIPRPPLPGRLMTSMTSEQENAFYADPDNQVPQGPPVRRKARLSVPMPVRFPEELLQQVRERAAADDRSVSGWIRRAVEHELARSRS